MCVGGGNREDIPEFLNLHSFNFLKMHKDRKQACYALPTDIVFILDDLCEIQDFTVNFS